MDVVPDEIHDPDFLDAGHRVNRYFRFQIITERGIGHFDDQKSLGRSRVTRDNVSMVKNQIRLRLILLVIRSGFWTPTRYLVFRWSVKISASASTTVR